MTTKNTPEIPEMERRYVEMTLRAAGDDENPVIEGYAAVFDVETVIMPGSPWGFREVIRPGAFQELLSENPDVIGAFNHDWNFVLARTTAGTLALAEDKKGLKYTIDVNTEDPQAVSVWQKVKRGDVSQSSFAFRVSKEQWTEPGEDSDELPLREILSVGKLYEVGPVPFAQYPEASAQARSQCEALLQKRQSQAASDGAEAIRARHEMRRRQIELAARAIYPSQ